MRRLYFASLLFIVACVSNTEEKQLPGHTPTTPVAMPEAFALLAKKDTHFSSHNFSPEADEQSSMQAIEQPLTKEVLAFQRLFIYNRDSSKAIDLFSYGHLLRTQKGQQIIEAGEPDTEAGLIDLRKGTRRRIYFSGPSVTLFDARWVNDSTIVLAGADNINETLFQPFMLQIHLTRQTAEIYRYNDTLAIDVQNLLQQRFPQVVFK